MVDRYTKTMLTIIAVCLVYLCCRWAFPVSDANAKPQSAPMDVNIVGISSGFFYAKLPVEVQAMPPTPLHVWVDNAAAAK